VERRWNGSWTGLGGTGAWDVSSIAVMTAPAEFFSVLVETIKLISLLWLFYFTKGVNWNVYRTIKF
jgi:hypothetical protein